jgi:hypothetical protein
MVQGRKGLEGKRSGGEKLRKGTNVKGKSAKGRSESEK